MTVVIRTLFRLKLPTFRSGAEDDAGTSTDLPPAALDVTNATGPCDAARSVGRSSGPLS